jgi:hypothetical protein
MRYHALIALAATVMIACGQTPEDAPATGDTGSQAAAEVGSEQLALASSSDADFVVYKSPTCGCCNGWIDHLRAEGYTVEAIDVVAYQDLQDTKRAGRVPADLESCHTATIEGYVIEGHVPGQAIERLLEERPDIQGLAVAGMPIGSPGMEGPNPQPYDVIAFTEDGRRSVFQRVDPTQPRSDAR